MMVSDIIRDNGGEISYNNITVDGNIITANRNGLTDMIDAVLNALNTGA